MLGFVKIINAGWIQRKGISEHMPSKRKGWVYVLSNPSIPGKVKIGFTDRAVEMRMDDLFDTGLPTRFVKEYEALVVDAQKLERQVHALLKPNRINDRREFFECSPEFAVNAITSKANELNIEILHQEAYCATPEDNYGMNLVGSAGPINMPVPQKLNIPGATQQQDYSHNPEQITISNTQKERPFSLPLFVNGVVFLFIAAMALIFGDLNLGQQIIICGLIGGVGLVCVGFSFPDNE